MDTGRANGGVERGHKRIRMKDGMSDWMLAGSLSKPDLAQYLKNFECQGVLAIRDL